MFQNWYGLDRLISKHWAEDVMLPFWISHIHFSLFYFKNCLIIKQKWSRVVHDYITGWVCFGMSTMLTRVSTDVYEYPSRSCSCSRCESVSDGQLVNCDLKTSMNILADVLEWIRAAQLFAYSFKPWFWPSVKGCFSFIKENKLILKSVLYLQKEGYTIT